MTSQTDWLVEQVDNITDTVVSISPSEWAETYRRLPASQALPGPYDYAVAPYLVEIVNCMDTRSPIRKIVMMKGAQTCGTVGVGENAIGYFIHHVKVATMMFVTATQPLAALRMDEYILPMLQDSGLGHLIQNNSENKRKAGATAKKVSWYGGGFLIPTSANEAASLRSVSIRVLILDEVDSYPLRVGRDGDPIALAERRTASFTRSKKTLLISTPTTTEDSKIASEYETGDKRVYELPCLGCGEFQELKWSRMGSKNVQEGGVIWTTTPEGNVEPGSVHYVCHHCGHCHTNEDKRDWLAMGRWTPTAVPESPGTRSYHVSALMSPADFYSWEDAAKDWIKAWNVETGKPRDAEKLQEFYNNVLGEPYRTTGSRLTLAKVGRHVRDYVLGTVPNELAEGMAGAKVGFLTCSIDVQKDWLVAAVYAWAPNRVGYVVDYQIFKGDTADPYDKDGPWGKAAELIGRTYRDDAGTREYPIKITLVDSGWGERVSEVYGFCSQYKAMVYPLKGEAPKARGGGREFSRIENISRAGLVGWGVNVDHYKARLSAVLNSQPGGPKEPALVDSVSFPVEGLPDAALKELTAEERVAKKSTGKLEWKRIHARNELWDLTVYCSAARDIAAYLLMREHFELDVVDWSQFWPLVDNMRWGWADATPLATDTPIKVD